MRQGFGPRISPFDVTGDRVDGGGGGGGGRGGGGGSFWNHQQQQSDTSSDYPNNNPLTDAAIASASSLTGKEIFQEILTSYREHCSDNMVLALIIGCFSGDTTDTSTPSFTHPNTSSHTLHSNTLMPLLTHPNTPSYTP